MGKRPSLSEVKAYFKNAVTVIPVGDTEEVDITKNIQRKIHEWHNCYWIDISDFSGTSVLLWDDKLGYAKILTYKTKQMKISKENIIKLDKKETTVRELFPEGFASVIEKGKWYKLKKKHNNNSLIFVVSTEKYELYGFKHSGEWFEAIDNRNGNYNHLTRPERYKEATNEEVFEALKGEAVKRGFKEGVYFIDQTGQEQVCNGYMELNEKYRDVFVDGLCFGKSNGLIFRNGVWSEIIKVKEMTQSQIENELGYKIKIV